MSGTEQNNGRSDGNSTESDGANYQHLGYYVRREDGELVLIETLLIRPDGEDEDQADIYTVHLDLEQLEPGWVEEVNIQGAHLIEAKSCEFIPPDEDEDESLNAFESDDE
jgi:hypothetical protein